MLLTAKIKWNHMDMQINKEYFAKKNRQLGTLFRRRAWIQKFGLLKEPKIYKL